MRVHFDDDTTAEIVRRIGGMAGTDLKFQVGDIVPVRYNPGDRNKIELDEDSLRAEQQYARESAQRRVDRVNEQAVRDAEAKLAKNQAEDGHAGPTAGDDVDRINRLIQLADLRDRGVLSNADFEIERVKILDES